MTARAGVSDIKLVVSAPMPLNGFVLEISNDPISRADYVSFTISDQDRFFSLEPMVLPWLKAYSTMFSNF